MNHNQSRKPGPLNEILTAPRPQSNRVLNLPPCPGCFHIHGADPCVHINPYTQQYCDCESWGN